jgi:hypothetical protein
LLGQVGSQLLHALSTGPQFVETPGSSTGIQISDGLVIWTPRPGQVGFSRSNGVITIPGAGAALPNGLPDQLAALLADGGAGVPEQPGVAQAAPPSRGQQHAGGGPGSPQPQGATPASVNDGDSPEQIARSKEPPGFDYQGYLDQFLFDLGTYTEMNTGLTPRSRGAWDGFGRGLLQGGANVLNVLTDTGLSTAAIAINPFLSYLNMALIALSARPGLPCRLVLASPIPLCFAAVLFGLALRAKVG